MSSTVSARRAWPIAAVAIVLAIVAALLVPVAASAATVSVGGNVVTRSGSAVAGVKVDLVQQFGQALTVASTTSSATGSFTIPSADPGYYSLRFAATATTHEQYLGGANSISTSQTLNLLDGGGNTTYVTATLSPSGSLGGQVTTLAGAAIPKYEVRAYRATDTLTWPLTATTTTTAQGTYSFASIEPGTYRVEVIDTVNAVATYAPAYSGGATSLDSATPSIVTGASTTTVNFSLGTAGRVSGAVTGAFGSATEKLAGVTVTPYRLDGVAGSYSGATSIPSRSTLTNAAGAYTVSGLVPGDYALEFRPRTAAPLPASGVVYGRTFLGGTSALNSRVVRIGNGTAVVGSNIQLVGSATVTGTVRDIAAPATGLAQVRVTIEHDGTPTDASGTGAASVITDTLGNYSFTGLGAGDYQLVVGSHIDTPGDGVTESTSWIRRTQAVTGITGGETRVENVDLEAKDPLGLHTTTQPVVTAGGPWKVGTTLTATRGTWNVEESTTFGYQWMRGTTVIPGATEPEYTIDPGDQYYPVSVRITAKNFAYGTATSKSVDSPTINAGPAAVQTATAASISGDFHVGGTLVVDPGTWSVSGALFQYSWQHSPVGGNWVQFGTGTSVALAPADITNPQVRVVISGSKFGWSNFTTTVAAASPVVLGEFSATGSPKVTRSGAVATVTGTTWAPSSGTSEFLWRTWDTSGSTAVTTGTTLNLADKAGRLVTVQERRTGAAFTTALSPIVVVQTGAAPVNSGAVAFAAPARVGAPLVAPVATWTPAATSTTYVWKYKSGSSWKAIAGATSASYTPLAADLGRVLRVEQRPVVSGYAAASLTTTAAAAVAMGAAPAVSGAVGEAPSVTGAVGINSVVTAHPGVWMPAPAAFSYQWSSSTDGTTFTPVPTATAAALEIPASLLGRHLQVALTTKTPGLASTTVVVDAGIVTGGTLKLTKAPVPSHSGTVYSTTPGTWAPVADSVDRSWYTFDSLGTPLLQSFDDEIDVATLPNRPLAVRLTAESAGFTPTSTGIILARAGTFSPTPNLPVTLSGSSPVGTALTAPESPWGAATPTLKYAWQVQSGSSWKAIVGATASTFTPSGSYLGKKLRVVTSASFVNYTNGSTTSAPVAITLAAAPTATAPAISGAVSVGSTITATPGPWSTPDLTFSYQWQAHGLNGFANIGGATKPSYTVADTYFDKGIRVIITAKKTGYTTGTTVVETPSTVGFGTMTNTKKPTATLKKGVYTATPGTWSVTPGTVEYQWDVIDPATSFTLSSTTGKTFTPAASDSDKLIALSVGVQRNNYTAAYETIVVKAAPKITPVTPLGITGETVVGQTLVATSGDWSTVGLSLDYQWYRNSVAITGATGSSYLQTAADIGATISVRFLPVKPGHPTATYLVAAAPTLSDVVVTATAPPTISGSVTPESVLTATPGTWSAPGLAFSYQWYRASLAIPGATGTTYALVVADRGHDIHVVVTASKRFHADGAAASAALNITYGMFLSVSAPTGISGTGVLGSTLNAEVFTWNVPVTLAYFWQRKPAGSSTWVNITGAGAASYTPTAADGFVSGDSVRVGVRASRPGYYENTSTSTAIVIQ